MTNKLFQNAKWFIVCRIVQSLIQFVVGMLSARYLGPSNYGVIHYAVSITAFFIPLMELGLSNTLVQEYVAFPQKEGQVLGTALAMNIASAIVCVAGVITFTAVAGPDDRTTFIVCVLHSTSMLFMALEITQYWFQAKLLSKYSSLAMLCAYVLASAYKVFLLVSGRSIYWFALSHTVEYGATGLFLLIAYRRNGKQKMCFSFQTAKGLFLKSKHYILATLMVVFGGNCGNVLLTHIVGETENGLYAAAVTCNSITIFAFLAIIDTARPVILESIQKSHAAFEKNISRLYSITTYLSLAQSIGFTVFAWLIVKVLYGEDYLPAIPVLQILVWNTAFSYMGYVRNIWILGEGKHKILFVINLSGAIISLVANACLIPLWGACGAAVASVITQVFTNFIMGFILKPVRENNRLLLKGLNPKLLVEMVQMFLAENKKQKIDLC